MHIAVIGTGGIGSALATLFARHGHHVILGSRDPERVDTSLRDLVAGRVVSYRAAVADADLLCLCVPWEHLHETLERLGDLSGKILLDPSNPETPDGRRLALGHSTSGAETISARVPGAKVVKAFNYVYAELLRDARALEQLKPSIFFSTDDGDARKAVTELITSCGLEAIDCGALENARYLEPLALLMVQLVRVQGWAPADVAMKLAHRG